ncbi:MAG: TIGR00730 family Rossman fold protein [Thermodesulfobacteriota bacterium]
MKRICVFCGSSNGIQRVYSEAARAVGVALARRNIGLVYGGGGIGLMSAVAEAVIKEGGEVIGVIPQALFSKEVAHQGLKDLRVVGSMHERKALMAELSDGFIALPGGYGTLEEFCEVLTWAQLGFHRKPCGILNVEGFYNQLLLFLDHAVSEGFVHELHRSLVLEDQDPERLLDRLMSYKPPLLDKWIDLGET